jgi:integrase/recombinase XerC
MDMATNQEVVVNPQPVPALSSGDPSVWDQALLAFLVEKGNKSGSKRTVESYSRMLWPFFAARPPDSIRPADVLAYAHGIGASGRPPSPTTIGARIACLSSFYRFLIRMGLVAANPCDSVERPRAVAGVARGLSAEQVRRLLAGVPDTVAGRRDRAILLTFILTGRRRTEIMSLTAADITIEEGIAFYSYRGKGGKRGRRELPAPAYAALVTSLADIGLTLAAMEPDASVWHAGSAGTRLSGSSFYGRFQRYLRAADLPPTGPHVLRHSAAKLRRDAGESVEAVSSFLDHGSLAVTTTYLRRLEGQTDTAWREVATALGV